MHLCTMFKIFFLCLTKESSNIHLFFHVILLAVRYGRVPKRTREINNSSNVISTTSSSSCINISSSSSSCNNNNSNKSSIISTTTTTNSPNNTPILDELNSIDSSKVGGGGGSEPSTPQMCPVATSPETMMVLSPSSDHHELTVYDVILCVSQAHHTYCTYTDEHMNIRGLTRCPITLPVSENKDDNNVSP